MKRLLLACALLCAALPAWSATYEETFTPKANKAYNEDINVWVYTSEFATRFGMPEKWVDDDLVGAFAVAFRVETTPDKTMFPHKGPDVSMPTRYCILDVYLAASANIPWIDDQIADKKWFTPDSPTYLLPQTPSDQKWRRRAVGIPEAGKRSRRSLIYVHASGKYLGGLFVREYDKELYPGVMYLSFNKGCVTPPKTTTTVDFSDYNDPYSPSREYTIKHRIRIPESFMKRLYADWAEKSRRPAEGDWRGVIKRNTTTDN